MSTTKHDAPPPSGEPLTADGFTHRSSTRVQSTAKTRCRPLFEGFFVAGFECSDHKLEDGRRLDLLTSTRHDEFAHADYARARAVGMHACRDGVSWVRCESRPGEYDFSSLLPRLRAAEGKIEVFWDLMHFGWPDHVDIFGVDFPTRFGKYVQAFARWFSEHTDMAPCFCPINEMSFLSWAGGDVGVMNPFCRARGFELKTQFVLATIEAIEALRLHLPGARILHAEPAINIVRSPEFPLTWRGVESNQLLQYQALDMLSGRVMPRLGGDPRYLDIVGVNFYGNNQFTVEGSTVPLGDARFKPFSSILLEIWQRYQRPMIVSETGAEGEQRAPWLRYIAQECERALELGVELHGITLYPVTAHPGWVDDRHCQNGLWDYADEQGERPIDEALAAELREWTPRLLAARAARLEPATLAPTARAQSSGLYAPEP
ncbi:MAG: hypothetical protein JWN04_6904 [Myxococcaceae bacterium]|nr:hypothetical protein [Myxococcaceae bacterium]